MGTHNINIGTPAFLSSKMELDAQFDNTCFPQLEPPINGIISTHNMQATTAVFATAVATVATTIVINVLQNLRKILLCCGCC
mmetsp:Transcript_62547/g.152285  ORF Transcript_62547/g.152285 Transcript_62547/m.152285 type:complete len:82 (+) Transcript_62547:2511-2756(+)